MIQDSNSPAAVWQTSRFQIDLGVPRVMGIVNVTPDSFSDGGDYYSPNQGLDSVFAHCAQLLSDGADILDIGGESTRPGALAVPLEVELARVLPVLRHALTLGVPVSLDSYKPQVMQAALDLGVDIINDVWALRQPGALQVVASHPACGVCLMHMHREPQSMQTQPMQGEVLPQVLAFLQQRAAALTSLGVAAARITLDPGIGFGKTPAQNFSLLARQRELLVAGYPLLAGWSRKSSLSSLLPAEPAEPTGSAPDNALRMLPSVSAALLAVERGAKIVRVHDVRQTVLALKVWSAAR